MRILHVSPAFFPATFWGGPIYSLHGLCNALASQEGVEVRVLTSNSAGPKLSEKVDVPEYPASYTPGYKVYFCRRLVGASFAPGMLTEMPRLIHWADIVHVTAVYSPPTIPALLSCRALGKPVVWSPRGAFQRWEGSTRPLSKAAWDAICRWLIVPHRTVIHTTSEEEAEAVLRRMRPARVAVIPNGVELPDVCRSQQWTPQGNLRLLYLGRLHPIKGIENLLRALASLEDRSISLRIVGSGESSYVASLRALAESLGLQGQAFFVGEVAGDQKAMAFQWADACVVPSFSENFGMVVAESLAHTVPVIAARGTPWGGLVQHACGLWVCNSPEELAGAILKIREQDLRAMGERGRNWMAESFRWDQVAAKMIDVYRNLKDDCG